jgi:hypothetical protein
VYMEAQADRPVYAHGLASRQLIEAANNVSATDSHGRCDHLEKETGTTSEKSDKSYMKKPGSFETGLTH